MRTLTVAGQALLDRAVAGEKIPLVRLVEAQFTVPQYWAVCGFPLVWNSHTWVPNEIQVSSIEHDVGALNGFVITLPGVTPAEIALAFDTVEDVPVLTYMALVDPADGTVADAWLEGSGQIDTAGFEDGATATIHFSVESRGALMLRQRPSRYTNDEQQRLYPGDTCLDYDPAQDAAGLVWPAASYFHQ